MLIHAIATHSGITEGRWYVAAGMMTNTDGLWFFTLDDHNIPRAIPAHICRRESTSMPDTWFVGTWTADSYLNDHAALHGASTVWGYPELVFDPGHWGLVDVYQQDAVDVFCAYHQDLVSRYDCAELLSNTPPPEPPRTEALGDAVVGAEPDAAGPNTAGPNIAGPGSASSGQVS